MLQTEKQVKRQAREALKGNFVPLLAAMGLVFVAVLLAECVQSLLLVLTHTIDLDTEKVIEGKELLYYAIAVGTTMVFLLLAPLINGFCKAAAKTAVHKRCEAGDVFYYFRGASRYFKTLLIDLLLYVLFSTITSVLDLSAYLVKLMPQLEDLTFGFNGETALVVGVGVLTAAIRVLVYMLLVHYPLTVYALNDDVSVGRCVFGSFPFALRHFPQLFRLGLSFLGWFALCFFVLPLLYVVPYFAVAAMTSSRWLLELDKNRGVK